jgi:hypothetical protein
MGAADPVPTKSSAVVMRIIMEESGAVWKRGLCYCVTKWLARMDYRVNNILGNHTLEGPSR